MIDDDVYDKIVELCTQLDEPVQPRWVIFGSYAIFNGTIYKITLDKEGDPWYHECDQDEARKQIQEKLNKYAKEIK